MGPDGPASPSSTSQRRLRLVLVYGVVLLPVVIWHAMQAVQTTANSPLDWAPSNFPARVDYDAFSRTFGPGDVVILSWKGCTTDATELDTLVEALRTDSAFFDEGTWLFDQVACGRELIQQMLALGIDRTEAVQRLHHTMIGPDGATTCVVIGFTKQALLQRSRLVPRIQEVTEQHCHVAASDQHLAGPVIDGLAADLASAATLQKLALPSSVVVFLVGLCCLGSWRSTLVVFGISLYCQAATLSLISICGDTASALLIVLPPLIQVLALAAGIHLVNYFGNAESGATAAEAARQAFRIGWLPCVLSAGTTAIGMASLMVSDLTPIRSFGAYSTVGLLLTTSLVLALVPTALAILGFTVSSKHSTTRRAPRTLTDRNTHWQPLFVLVTRHHVAIVLLFLTSMGALGWSMSRLETSVRIETLFAPQSRILSDYRWLEDNLSPLVPIEVVLTFDRAAQESVQQRLDHVRRVESILKEHPQVRGTLSAVTFMPVMPDHRPRTREEAMATQQFVANAMSQANSRWVDMRLLSETNGRQQWRIRGLVSALEQTDYGELLSAIRQHLASAATEPGMSLHATGIMPLVHDIQRQLMHDLRSSFLLAFVIITIVMTVMQGSVEGGLVAMLPNVFPTLAIFGLLGWLRVPVDIGSVMTASIALGIAVDDTFHFLTYFQRRIEEGDTRQDAVFQALEHCGKAMLQTSLICGAGMLVFALSDFQPSARFAWMMVALFAAAIFGDLVLLPALLVGPLGKLWEIRERPSSQRTDSDRRHLVPGQDIAASTVKPGPNANAMQRTPSLIVPRRSSMNAAAEDDMFS